MEFEFGEILLRHVKHIARISQKHISAFTVQRHILLLSTLKRFQSLLVVALNPASLIQVNGFPSTACAIFMKQTILNYFKLELTYGANNLAIVELIDKELRHTFVHKLLNTLAELLSAHWIGILNVFKHFWRETWQSLEVEQFSLGKCVANFECAVIWQTHNVARINIVNHLLFLRHKGCRSGKSHLLVAAHMVVILIAVEHART